MIEILRHIQNKCVPQKLIKDTDTTTDVELIKSIPFGGDQLTEERAINVQKALLDGETNYEKNAGIKTQI